MSTFINSLTNDELNRYDRHLKLPNFGLDKQKKLKEAKVLIVGAGGLGCPIALYLAGTGIGSISIVDNDRIDISNLQRQIAFTTDECGQLKAEILCHKINELNPLIKVNALIARVKADNVMEIIANHDLVIDGTDNFATRFLLADACYLAKTAYLHASVYQYQGQISLFEAGSSPCFRCLFRNPPSTDALPACSEAGILGSITGVIGSLVATETIKYLANIGNSLAGKILVYDFLQEKMRKIDIEVDENCPLCSKNSSIRNMQDSLFQNGANTNTNNCINRLEFSEQIISIKKASELLNNSNGQKPFLLDVREEHEFQQGHIEGASLWPLSEIQSLPAGRIRIELKNKIEKAIKDKKTVVFPSIICYCQRGARSLKALTIMRDAGIENIFSLDGGFEAWDTSVN